MYKRFTHGAGSILVFDLQGNMRGQYFPYEPCTNYIYACTVKLYNTLNAQNALVKSTHCVREYNLCNLISLYNIYKLHLLMEAHHALSAVRTEVLYIMHFNFSL